MEILTLRTISRILMIVCGLVTLIYGIVLCSKDKGDSEELAKIHKKGKSYILCGIVLLISVAVYILI